jgi:hypothetical protein
MDPGESVLEQYYTLTYYTLAHPDPSFVHQHVVDAYTAQTAGAGTKPIAVAFALFGLYLFIERGTSGRDVQRMDMLLARRRHVWPSFRLPAGRGTITVADVLAAPPGAQRDDLIRQWCVSVWEAWHESHAQVREFLRTTLET